MNQAAISLVRLGSMLAIVLVCALVVILHGARGLLFVAAVIVAFTMIRSTIWRQTEARLNRITGSRSRTYASLLGLLILVVAGINIYDLVH